MGVERFDLVIFDCDGVVVDSEILSCQCLVDIFGRYGMEIGMDEVFERFLGRSSSAIDAYYAGRAGTPLPPAFRADYREHLGSSFAAKLRPMPHAVDVLTTIGKPYCLASSSDGDRLRLTLAVTGLDGFFGDRVFNSAMVARGKPAPDLFLYASGKMATEPGRALVIEDSVTGVAAGKAAGMTVWGFTGGSHCAGRDVGHGLTEAGADRVFTTLAELAA